MVPDNNPNTSEEISNLDDDETDTNAEVIIDDAPILELNKHDQTNYSEVAINLDDDLSFIAYIEITDAHHLNY